MRRRIAQLDAAFLPPISRTGDYTRVQYDQVRAYVVLSHAEIEHYLEAIADETLTSAKTRWQNNKRAGRCAAALMMYSQKKIESPRRLSAQSNNETFEAHLVRLANQHSDHVTRENHGIKEKNILGIFLPIGVLEDDLDPVWLGTMNTFGVQRGIVAHSAASAVQTPPDPASMRAMVSDVLTGLDSLKPVFRALKRS